MNLSPYFDITEKSIIGKERGSEFLFKGIHEDPDEIKSTEGITDCWLEEAEKTTQDSLTILYKTIRLPGSQIIATWNPEQENSPIDVRARKNHNPDEAFLVHVSYRDNEFHSAEMEKERLYDLRHDPDNYDWIWEGGYRRISHAAIFARKAVVEEFETPDDARLFYGADWGFSNDPTVLVRLFMSDDTLYVDYEAYGYQTELDDIGKLFDTIPGSRRSPIKADCSRPETISYMKRAGFNISAAEKWKGSVEDGVEYLRKFKRIVVHPRCPRFAQESRLYSYKTDKRQVDEKGQPVILPDIEDANNHGFDAARYALDGYIKRKPRGVFDIL